MQRNVTIALALAVVVLAVILAVKSMPHADSGPTIDAAVAIDAAAVVAAGADASAVDDSTDDLEATPTPDGGAFHLADGTIVLPLGPKAPKQVRFGVVLVVYQGAQGAPAKARGKSDALAMATKLAESAKTDFAGAVHSGDDGSAPDIGIVDRNILEPTSEAVLFALPVGGTSGVIDTPRGFWIVKRLE
jgi:hypothetical protein